VLFTTPDQLFSSRLPTYGGTFSTYKHNCVIIYGALHDGQQCSAGWALDDHENALQIGTTIDRAITKDINAVEKQGLQCTQRHPSVHGLLMLNGQARRKWHITLLGRERHIVPRHVSALLGDRVQTALNMGTNGEVVDEASGARSA